MLGALQRRLAAGKADMEDLIARLRQESALTEFLHSKVKDLEGELESGRETLRQVQLTRLVLGKSEKSVIVALLSRARWRRGAR